jgi:hypothetical protein
MLQNITLSAEKDLIEQARRQAQTENSTLNAEFRRWLEQYVSSPGIEADFDSLMSRLVYAQPGKTFTRDERNER